MDKFQLNGLSVFSPEAADLQGVILDPNLPPDVINAANQCNYVEVLGSNLNVFVGENAGPARLGAENTFVGASSGQSAGNNVLRCVYVGAEAGASATGEILESVAIGSQAAFSVVDRMTRSVAVGHKAAGNTIVAEDSVILGDRAAAFAAQISNSVAVGSAVLSEVTGNVVEQSVVIGSRAGYHAGNVFSTTAIGHETLSRVTVDGSTVVGSRIMGDLPIALSNCTIVGEGLTVSPLVLPTYDTIKHIGGETRRVALTRASTRHDMSATFVCPIDEVYISVFGIPEPTVNEDGVSSGSIPSSSPFVDIVDGKMYLGGFGSASHEGIVIVHTSGKIYGFVDGIPIDPATGTTFQTGFVKPADGTVSIYGWTQGALPFATFNRRGDFLLDRLSYSVRGDGTTFEFSFESGRESGTESNFPSESRTFTIIPSPEAMRKMRSRTSYAAVLAFPWYDPDPETYINFEQYVGYLDGTQGALGTDISVTYFSHLESSGELVYPTRVSESVFLGCNTSFPSGNSLKLQEETQGALYVGLGEYMLCKADQLNFNVYSSRLRIVRTLAIGDGYSLQYNFGQGAVISNVLSEHRFQLNSQERLRLTSNGTVVYGRTGSALATDKQGVNPSNSAFFISMPYAETANISGYGINGYINDGDALYDKSWMDTTATRTQFGGDGDYEYLAHVYKTQNKYDLSWDDQLVIIRGGYIEHRLNGIGLGVGSYWNNVGSYYDNGREIMTLTRLGNVGIGTSTPQETLSVNGTCSITGNSVGQWYLLDNRLYRSARRHDKCSIYGEPRMPSASRITLCTCDLAVKYTFTEAASTIIRTDRLGREGRCGARCLHPAFQGVEVA
jgi:hypothetical protein